MTDKEFKTIDEQLEILKQRGLTIDDDDIAKDFLLKNNYYRVSGYSLTLRKNDVFSVNASFQNIMDIYNFDHELRHILLKYIEKIENTVKSIFAYEFTKKHGPTGYLEESNFLDVDIYNDIMKKTEELKKVRQRHEAYLKHFINDRNQEIPFWAYVDLFTIANISFMYSISEEDIKTAVSDKFGFARVKGKDLLGRFMHSITIIRNLCAHGSRLYNRLFEQKPSLNREDKKLLIVKDDGTLDNAHLYGFILIMRRLLVDEEFDSLKKDIIDLTDKYPFVNMKYYGFRDDWKEKL